MEVGPAAIDDHAEEVGVAALLHKESAGIDKRAIASALDFESFEKIGFFGLGELADRTGDGSSEGRSFRTILDSLFLSILFADLVAGQCRLSCIIVLLGKVQS